MTTAADTADPADDSTPDSAPMPHEAGADAGHGERRTIDATALHGLAHPLRVRLWDALVTHGSATASQLAERLGESSGATSYHLRRLAKYGFVEEDIERGTKRERWWRVPRGTTNLEGYGMLADPATREATNLVLGEWRRARLAAYEAFATSAERWPAEWQTASAESTAHLRLRADELAELVAEHQALTDRWVTELRDRPDVDGLVRVEIQLLAFPVGQPEDAATSAAVEPGRPDPPSD